MSFPLTSYWWPSRIAKPDVDEAREVLSSGREGQHLGTMKPSPMRVLPQGLWKGKIRASSPTSPFGETKPALRLHSALGRDHRGHLISEWLKDGTWSQTSWVQTLALPFLGPKTLDTLFNPLVSRFSSVSIPAYKAVWRIQWVKVCIYMWNT